MSIATAISNAQAKVAAAYAALQNKGATMPSVRNLSNLPDTINSIQMGGGGTLPYDAEVEYLQSDGSQYIDTGVVATKNYVIIADCAVISGSSFPTVIGALSASNEYSVVLAYNNSGQPYTQMGSNFSFLYSTNKFGSTIVHYICQGDESKQYISDEQETSSAAFSGTLSTLSMYLLARHRHDTSVGNYTKAKIGKVSITIRGVLQRDYIPVRVGTVGYMYDKVSGMLFGNSGTGNFTLGPDVI